MDYLTIDDILDADVAAADAVLAGRVIDSPVGVVEQVFVANVLPYQPGDGELIASDGNLFPVVRKYWPGAADWLADHGYLTQPDTPFLLFRPTRLPMMASPDRARTLLGRPRRPRSTPGLQRMPGSYFLPNSISRYGFSGEAMHLTRVRTMAPNEAMVSKFLCPARNGVTRARDTKPEPDPCC